MLMALRFIRDQGLSSHNAQWIGVRGWNNVMCKPMRYPGTVVQCRPRQCHWCTCCEVDTEVYTLAFQVKAKNFMPCLTVTEVIRRWGRQDRVTHPVYTWDARFLKYNKPHFSSVWCNDNKIFCPPVTLKSFHGAIYDCKTRLNTLIYISPWFHCDANLGYFRRP